MPLPVIAGIPWLAGVIGGIFSALVTFLTSIVTKRIAIITVGLGVLTALTTAFGLALHGLTSGLSSALPYQFSVAVSWVIPNNFVACASACISARVLRWVYEWNVKIVQLKLF